MLFRDILRKATSASIQPGMTKAGWNYPMWFLFFIFVSFIYVCILCMNALSTCMPVS